MIKPTIEHKKTTKPINLIIYKSNMSRYKMAHKQCGSRFIGSEKRIIVH